MPYHDEQLSTDIDIAFSSLDQSLSSEERHNFKVNVTMALHTLNKGYLDAYMPEKLAGMHQLQTEFDTLQMQCYRKHVNAISRDDLIQILSDKIKAAYSALSLTKDMIDVFVISRAAIWIDFFIGKINDRQFDLNQVLTETAELIATEFAQKIIQICSYDLYTSFFTEVTYRLLELQDDVIAATNINAMKLQVARYTPGAYQAVCKPAANWAEESHPLNAVHRIHNALFTVIPNRISNATIHQALHKLQPLIAFQRDRLIVLHEANDPLAAIQATRENFLLRIKASRYLEPISWVIAGAYISVWIAEQQLQHIGRVIMDYNNSIAVKRAARQIHNMLMAEIAPHISVPTMNVIVPQRNPTARCQFS